MTMGERAEALARGVLGPVVLGGPLELQRPFGPKLAVALGDGRGIVDNDLKHRVDTARLRVARSVVPIDAIAPPAPLEWALAAALNDLAQVTNHELSSFATRGRHPELLDAVNALVLAISPCRNLEEAVGRHATFSRVLEVARTDTEVSWWTGSQSFRGQAPPARLLAWPGLRNVRVQKTQVTLANMAGGASIDEEHFDRALAAWLACSPLSDLASAHRQAPTFRWSRHTIALVATVGGSNLALRAISHATDDDPQAAQRAVEVLREAASELAEPAPKKIAGRFAEWLDEAKGHWAEIA